MRSPGVFLNLGADSRHAAGGNCLWLTHPHSSGGKSVVPSGIGAGARASKALLEKKLGVPVLDFAFPFGKASDCGSAALGVLARYGYRSATTTVPGVNTPQVNPFELRRLQVGFESYTRSFAFDLGRAFLRSEELHALNVPFAGPPDVKKFRFRLGSALH